MQEKDEKGVAKGATGTWTNCWADEVFVLDGKEAGVGCFVDAMTMHGPDAKNCVLGMYGMPPNPYNGEGTEAAALKALEKAGPRARTSSTTRSWCSPPTSARRTTPTGTTPVRCSTGP